MAIFLAFIVAFVAFLAWGCHELSVEVRAQGRAIRHLRRALAHHAAGNRVTSVDSRFLDDVDEWPTSDDDDAERDKAYFKEPHGG